MKTYIWYSLSLFIFNPCIIQFYFSDFHLSTCGARGKDGPRTDQCISAYNRTEMAKTVRTIVEKPYRGVQVWKVPRENYYT